MHLQVPLALDTDAVTAGRMLADPVYVRAKVLAGGGEVLHVDVTPGENGAFTVTTRRALPTDLIPSQARAFIGDRLEVRQAEAWEGPDDDGGRRGTVAVEIAGAPVRLTGTVALIPEGERSRVVYDGDLKASVPLFGAMVEEAAAKAVRSALQAEEAVAAEWVRQAGA
ncbi:DUF2505 domain-containing protein [Cellulomonas denverensis]|uniref:DUF2505 domain-containing protein n=1 Tax=Cellulomonas denverensis TaxID=264297 RepID=A0A7X6KUH8_9CELL|nr:DUF2505 domain-containing protein [Cellulomonas denverensis]NKY22487.1 DUF2505 domain-containing protein [Cellulomonas denverensis]GIG25960.1 hypothetical protein Cde04nite_22040 [Cellulomonas denverensis]